MSKSTDALVGGGYAAAGYVQVSDDCWSAGRKKTTGEHLPDPARFSKGMKALVKYLHSKGLKFRICSDIGSKTCTNYAGSEGYKDLDAATFASWVVDFLKLCGFNMKKERFEEWCKNLVKL
mmetsp:Transcript_31324/g.48017  ORF Transcript_31324/g.48017 Transcript_31324/m.48017 type:complete len:121 (-) Transcript_31324:841-1203(-)